MSKKISRCTIFGVFFSAASCKKRHQKRCIWIFIWPFLVCDGFKPHNFYLAVQDRCIVSSIYPKLDDQFFVDIHTCFYKLRTKCDFYLYVHNWRNNFMFTTCTKHVSQQVNAIKFWLIN